MSTQNVAVVDLKKQQEDNAAAYVTSSQKLLASLKIPGASIATSNYPQRNVATFNIDGTSAKLIIGIYESFSLVKSKVDLKNIKKFIKVEMSNNNGSFNDKDYAVSLDKLFEYNPIEKTESALGETLDVRISKTIDMAQKMQGIYKYLFSGAGTKILEEFVQLYADFTNNEYYNVDNQKASSATYAASKASVEAIRTSIMSDITEILKKGVSFSAKDFSSMQTDNESLSPLFTNTSGLLSNTLGYADKRSAKVPLYPLVYDRSNAYGVEIGTIRLTKVNTKSVGAEVTSPKSSPLRDSYTKANSIWNLEFYTSFGKRSSDVVIGFNKETYDQSTKVSTILERMQRVFLSYYGVEFVGKDGLEFIKSLKN